MKRICIFGILAMIGLFTANAQAGCWGEFFHHTFEMGYHRYPVKFCTHLNQAAEATVKNQYVSPRPDKIVGAAITVRQALVPTCYDKHSVKLPASVSCQRGMSVSVSDSQGTSITGQLQGAYQAGELAKKTVQGSLSWSASWNWTATNTYTENVTLTCGSEQLWPQSGKRKVTGPASVAVTFVVKGYRATAEVEARLVHKCKTTYVNGFQRETPYSDNGKIAFTAKSEGRVPVIVEVGGIQEEGAIENGCDE